jgi:starch phosphorylase
MKAAMNGALNCSILDGWWEECYDGHNGWAIGSRDSSPDEVYQDRLDASALYDLLERDIVPRFYDRSEGPVPRRWIERMKHSIGELGPFISADRMMTDYYSEFYEPAAKQAGSLRADSHARAKALAQWKTKLRDAWDAVRIEGVDGEVTPAGVGETRTVSAGIRLGSLDPGDVSVEIVHGPVGANGELVMPVVSRMEAGRPSEDVCTYEGSFTTDNAGLYGYAVRVLPCNKDLTGSMDLGLVTWA